MTVSAPISACPACEAAPLAQSLAAQDAAQGQTILSIPTIHCAACINTIECALSALPGVRSARVNLSRKRVTVDAPTLSSDTLIAALANAGFEAQELDAASLRATDADAQGRALLLRLAVAGFAMMNVMLFSVAIWSGASDTTRTLFNWLSAGIAIPTLIFSAQPFFINAWSSLQVARLNMDVPISLAILLAMAMSLYETTTGAHHVYFDAALSLTFFLLAGRYLDHRTRVAARSAAQELSALELPRAVQIVDGVHQTVDTGTLRPGDMVHVAAGMRAPVDGVVVTGASEIDRSILTGESLPVAVEAGATISAGEVNLSGPLSVRTTAVGDQTTLARMAAMAETGEAARNRYTALADRAARIYAPAVHLLALGAFVWWISATGDLPLSLNIAIAVLIITCPCALGLAVPAVMTAACGRLYRRGMLVKTGTALERLAEADVAVFDKTGTLTTGHARLDATNLSEEAASVLAALTAATDHPVARAVAAALPDARPATDVTQVRVIPGKGVEGQWRGQQVRLGRADWVGAETSPAFRIGAEPAQAITYSETLRDGAVEAVSALRDMGFRLLLCTGDAKAPADRVASELGIDEVHAGLSPEDKFALIQSLNSENHHSLMIGDGLNDTAALSAAHVSISPASALDASRAASDIVILRSDLSALPEAVKTARASRRRALENFGIAAGYNAIAIPIALAGLATPLAAAIAMSTSSITVLLNATRLR